MPWLLTLHITALLCWCGALLYLPALVIATHHSQRSTAAVSPPDAPSLPRLVYCRIATPTALIAIIAGTLVFYRYQIVDRWLILKLMLVTLLVGLHLLTGLLIARAEQHWRPRFSGYGYTLALLIFTTITATVWLVLAKPLRDW